MKKYMKASLLVFAVLAGVNLCPGAPTPGYWDEEIHIDYPPEYEAVMSCNLRMVKKFVQEGGNVNQRYVNYYLCDTLLHAAINHHRWEIAAYLLDSGASPRGKYGWWPKGTLLELSECRGAPREIVNKLKEAGAEN